MNYHDIRTDDMLNGEGLRVVLFVSGCEHHCNKCHNSQTWDCKSGEPFTSKQINEILNELNKDYIDGITLSGGDPMHPCNRKDILELCKIIKKERKDKTIWLYTGYTYNEIKDEEVLKYIDVVVDGKFEFGKMDINYPYAGSTNQKVIRVNNLL